jgi:Transposase IS66 family
MRAKRSGFLEHVRGQIAAAEVAGFDETGFRVQGRLHWVHCARTGKYTQLMVHPKRGTDAMKSDGRPWFIRRAAVHDGWARTTPVPVLSTSCAVRTPSASCRPSPTPRPQAGGAVPRPGGQGDYLRFTTDFRAPPDNNGSERAIRMANLRQRYPAAC